MPTTHTAGGLSLSQCASILEPILRGRGRPGPLYITLAMFESRTALNSVPSRQFGKRLSFDRR